MFENFTVAPYCRELIDMSLLSRFDVDYINQFHSKVIFINSFVNFIDYFILNLNKI